MNDDLKLNTKFSMKRFYVLYDQNLPQLVEDLGGPEKT